MNSVDKAVQTQLDNIQTKTGKSLEQLHAHIRASGKTKHTEIIAMLKLELALGHGDANALALSHKRSAAAPSTDVDPLATIYAGPKAELRPLHDKIMQAVSKFGGFDVAPKKGYISLRRNKQFAMITPATKTRVEIGLNMKGVKATARLHALPAGGMCQYKVDLSKVGEVDAELIAWIKQAYDSAG